MRTRTITFWPLLLACVLLAGCQSRSVALDLLCDAPSTCGAPCDSGDASARVAAMRAHLDATIENESVRRIYSEYWAGSTATELQTVGRAAMREERGSDDCTYFAWYAALPWPEPEAEPVDNAPPNP